MVKHPRVKLLKFISENVFEIFQIADINVKLKITKIIK